MQIFCSHFGSFFWVYAFSVYIFAHIWFSWSSLLPDEFVVCCLFLGLVCVRGHLTKRDGKNSHRYNCSSFSIPSWKSFSNLQKYLYFVNLVLFYVFFLLPSPKLHCPKTCLQSLLLNAQTWYFWP